MTMTSLLLVLPPLGGLCSISEGSFCKTLLISKTLRPSLFLACSCSLSLSFFSDVPCLCVSSPDREFVVLCCSGVRCHDDCFQSGALTMEDDVASAVMRTLSARGHGTPIADHDHKDAPSGSEWSLDWDQYNYREKAFHLRICASSQPFFLSGDSGLTSSLPCTLFSSLPLCRLKGGSGPSNEVARARIGDQEPAVLNEARNGLYLVL